MLAHDLLNTALALPPTPTTTPDPNLDPATAIHTEALVAWVVKYILPVGMLGLGFYIFGRHRRGNLSEVATASGISLWGIMVMAGGGAFFLFGEKLVHMVIG